MVDAREHAALVALLRRGWHPWQLYAGLLEERGSARAVLAQESTSGAPGRGSPGQANLFSCATAETASAVEERLDAAEVEIAAWRRSGITISTVLDEDYPENLRAVHDRPPLLFIAGRLAPRDVRSVAVVGARSASAEGLHAAAAITDRLVDGGYTVLSGLAQGIDTAAHRAALAHHGRTVAVIGTGLRRCYPPQNAALQSRIAAEHAVVSQFWPDAPPRQRSFPMRNAVMSGLSLATVLVDASHTSGARIQARRALAQGRPVLLWHSLLAQPWARSLAARPGTHVVAVAEEVTAVVERLSAAGELVAS